MTKNGWIDAAFWLADCHTATLEHEGSLKSCPETRRKRYRNIVVKARLTLRQLCHETGHFVTEKQAEIFARMDRAIGEGVTNG